MTRSGTHWIAYKLFVSAERPVHFIFGFSELSLKFRVGVEPCDRGARRSTRRIDVALIMESDDHAAFAVLITALQNKILTRRVDFREDERHRPAAAGMARRIGTVVPVLFLFPGDGRRFAELHVRALPHVLLFGLALRISAVDPYFVHKAV